MTFDYQRRHTDTVRIGNITMGGSNPIAIQSMTSISTDDIEAVTAQCRRIFDAGADLVRLTAQGVKEAKAIGEIRSLLRSQGYAGPLVADIHFNPNAALVAATTADKVRINPGNFVDAARTFKKLEYTDEEYAREIEKIRTRFVPFLDLCRANGTAIRLGVNHGSLSDRIMSRYGDTPAGMVESVMEYLRICREVEFTDVVISIKASNTVVMVETVRRLVRAMDAEGMAFPLHLGVTEAGDGEDGRIKSAVGIGALLAEGIGDTIRVSLSEEPECEVPVARKLVDYITARNNHPHIEGTPCDDFDAICPRRRQTNAVGYTGGENVPVVAVSGSTEVVDGELRSDLCLSDPAICEVWASEDAQQAARRAEGRIIALRSRHINPVGEMRAFIHNLTRQGCKAPVIAVMTYNDTSDEDLQIHAGADFGALLLDRLIDGICIEAPAIDSATTLRYAFGILQAVRQRISKTEFISCPSCGRTLFDLQTTVRDIKAATAHLKGLKIGIMGCIVNGPGEMADADYGYVGAAVGKVSLYKGKQCIERNIPQEQALDRLIEIIKENGEWVER